VQVRQPFLLIQALIALVVAVGIGGLLSEVTVILASFAVVSAVTAAPLFAEVRRQGSGGSDLVRRLASGALTFFAFQYAVLLGWKDYALGNRDVRWKKIESTRI
jgi:hypothetical protein